MAIAQRLLRSWRSYYADVYGNGRDVYAIPAGALSDPAKQRQMATFFWWTAWAASTNRPGQDVTYTQNWPHEELVGNRPTGGTIVWSVISFVLLLAGIGGMVWYFGSQEHRTSPDRDAETRSFAGIAANPVSESHGEIFLRGGRVVGGSGGAGGDRRTLWRRGRRILRHPARKWLPYSVARTWHLQIGIFWIATSWLATGLYIVPAVSGVEPKGQRLG